MARVTRDRLADADLAEIAKYIGQAKQSPAAARRFLDRPIDEGIDVVRVVEGHRDYPALFGPKP